MRQYKGYFIDHVIFNSKEDIDNFIKQRAIERLISLNEEFARKADMAIMKMISDCEDRLHDEFGMSYEELEEIGLKTIA